MASEADESPSRHTPQLQRRQGERVAGHLSRVRGEFIKFREWKQQLSLKGRPGGQTFHWDFLEDSDDETPNASAGLVPPSCTSTVAPNAWATESVAPLARGGTVRRMLEEAPSLDSLVSSELVMQCNYAFEQLHRKAIADIEEGIQLYFEPPNTSAPPPTTAAQQSAQRAWRALRLKHQRVPKMQSPWEPKAVERQVRHLRRAYSSSSAQLPGAASAAQRGEFYHREDPLQLPKESSLPGMAILRRLGLDQRLSSRGSGGGQRGADRKVVEGWLRQLAEDYPEDFCNLSGNYLLKDVRAALVAAQEDCSPENAQICSDFWVLRLHGNPMKPEDWQRRRAWLSRSGQLWLGAEGEGGDASLQLSGDLVSNWWVMRARRDFVETLDQTRVYAFSISSPVAKYHRRKLFASSNEELVEEWIKLCMTPPRRS